MRAKSLVRCGLCAAMLCVCAWLTVPTGLIPVTMQTFGVFLCLGLLGGKWGSICVACYLALGAVGLPVFSGFRGGLGALLNTTGGYLTGFLVMALFYWLVTALLGQGKWVRLWALALGMLLCYVFGTVWYWALYTPATTWATLWSVAAKCVLPFVIPDGIKLWLAWLLTNRLKSIV